MIFFKNLRRVTLGIVLFTGFIQSSQDGIDRAVRKYKFTTSFDILRDQSTPFSRDQLLVLANVIQVNAAQDPQAWPNTNAIIDNAEQSLQSRHFCGFCIPLIYRETLQERDIIMNAIGSDLESEINMISPSRLGLPFDIDQHYNSLSFTDKIAMMQSLAQGAGQSLQKDRPVIHHDNIVTMQYLLEDPTFPTAENDFNRWIQEENKHIMSLHYPQRSSEEVSNAELIDIIKKALRREYWFKNSQQGQILSQNTVQAIIYNACRQEYDEDSLQVALLGLATGVDFNNVRAGTDPLVFAMLHNFAKLSSHLVALGEVKQRNDNYIEYALRNDSVDLLKLCLSLNVDVPGIIDNETNVVRDSAMRNAAQCIQYLHSQNYDINKKDKKNNSPLFIAEFFGQNNAAQTLNDLGATPLTRTERNKIPGLRTRFVEEIVK